MLNEATYVGRGHQCLKWPPVLDILASVTFEVQKTAEAEEVDFLRLRLLTS